LQALELLLPEVLPVAVQVLFQLQLQAWVAGEFQLWACPDRSCLPALVPLKWSGREQLPGAPPACVSHPTHVLSQAATLPSLCAFLPQPLLKQLSCSYLSEIHQITPDKYLQKF